MSAAPAPVACWACGSPIDEGDYCRRCSIAISQLKHVADDQQRHALYAAAVDFRRRMIALHGDAILPRMGPPPHPVAT